MGLAAIQLVNADRLRAGLRRSACLSPGTENMIQPVVIVQFAIDGLTPEATSAIRKLLWAAFEAADDPMTEEDWQRCLLGVHFVGELDGEIVAYASVSERELELDGLALRAGYVEGVVTIVARQGQGIGTQLMTEVNKYIRGYFQLGALGTVSHHFYERLGWLTWQGPTHVRTADGLRRTPDEDGYILVLPTPSSPELDLAAPITCSWRPGDSW